jgi:rhodanese-related sulfurtransferase
LIVGFSEITPSEARGRLRDYRIVDVREAHELRGPLGFIDGAELFPLAGIEERADELSGSRSLLLVCRSGRRSGVACETLQELGIPDVTNLSGGMIAWADAGLPRTLNEPKTLPALRDAILGWLAQVSPLTQQTARELLRDRLGRQGASYDEPSHASLCEFIDTVETFLEAIDPPDLTLSLAFFRSSLAVL